MDWLLLSLISAFSLATSDALAKRYLHAYRAPELVLVRLVFPALLLTPVMLTRAFPVVPPAFWGWLAISLPLEILAMTLYVRALRDAPMSLSLPHLAFTPVFTAGIAWLVLDEPLSRTGLAGIALVVLGAFLLHAGTGMTSLAVLMAPLRALRRQPGVRSMFGVSVIYGVTTVTGKAAMQFMPSELFGAFYFVAVGILAAVAMCLLAPRSAGALARRPGIHLLIGAFFALMVISHFVAIDRAPAAYMIAIKRSSILFAVVYGRVMFGERDTGRRFSAAVVMLAGMLLIGLASEAA